MNYNETDMNYIVGYFSKKNKFHALEYFDDYEQATDWVIEKRMTRKDLIIYQRVDAQTLTSSAV
jgi:hypothetical protein